MKLSHIYCKKIQPCFGFCLVLVTVCVITFAPQSAYAVGPALLLLPLLKWAGVGIGGAIIGSGLSGVIGTAATAIAIYAALAPIGAALISFAGYVLMVSSTIFEVVLNTTVIGFGATLSDYKIIDGIKLVWTAFRDISNIVIVGMFVFVAIATILGSVNYGVKKFLVRILVVAVLINFSLLLTQLVIDVSHIAATQFYQGIRSAALPAGTNLSTSAESPSAISQAASTYWNQQGGLSGAFLAKMGVSTFWDTKTVLSKARAEEGFMIAFFYALAATAVLLATSAVFLYGSYLLISRALVIIFLLLTSSLAFASWLVPKYGEGKYGWDGWVDALIRSAVFAPLLMMFLWATLVVLSGVKPGSMGAFLQDPVKTNATATIFVYLLTIGMLYLSIKVASDFSQKITGFNIASAATRMGLRGVGATAGFLGRATAGEFARRKLGQTGYAEGLVKSSEGGGVGGLAAAARLGALKTLQAASFNPNRITKALKEGTANMNKRYGFDTEGKGGAKAGEERKAENEKKAREEAAKNIGPTEQEKKQEFDRELDDLAHPAVTAAKTELGNQIKAQKEMVEAIKHLETMRPGSSAEAEVVSAKRAAAHTKLTEINENIKKAKESVDETRAEARKTRSVDAELRKGDFETQKKAYKAVTDRLGPKGTETAHRKKEYFDKLYARNPYARQKVEGELKSSADEKAFEKRMKKLIGGMKGEEKESEEEKPASTPPAKPTAL